MEVFMRGVPWDVDEVELQRSFEPFLHGHPRFARFLQGAPWNFHIFLFPQHHDPSKKHTGCGVITVPTVEIGLALVSSSPVRIGGRTMHFDHGKSQPKPEILSLISEPYIDRATREKQERVETELQMPIGLVKVQMLWRSANWKHTSVEWQSKITEWVVYYEPARRGFVVRNSQQWIIIRQTSISSITQDRVSIIIAFDYPPTYEAEPGPKYTPPTRPTLDPMESLVRRLARTLLVPPTRHSAKRNRPSWLDEDHEQAAPYASMIRLFLKSPTQGLDDMKQKAQHINARIRSYRGSPISPIPVFQPHLLDYILRWLARVDFNLAFQCESIVRQALISPQEFIDVIPDINALISTMTTEDVVATIREFGSSLTDPNIPADMSVRDCLRISRRITQKHTSLSGMAKDAKLFLCHHITFTPSTRILSGPSPDQSNRVLRWYPDHHHHFIRVDFKEEDQFALRSDRETNSAAFIRERFGGILGTGFKIAERSFQFLAYSQSALRDHAVWFMTPFVDLSTGETVDAITIHRRLGDFKRPELLHCPARLGARISQAFSATHASVTLHPNEIGRLPDIRAPNGLDYTDGVGTMSPDVAEEIHDMVHRADSGLIHPSVVQFRQGGNKGTLSVDEALRGQWKVNIRPSMDKFDAPESRDVEISRVFDRPGRGFLNRPLIMLLDTYNIPRHVFLQLQQDAISATKLATRSLRDAATLLDINGLGTSYSLRSLFLNLEKINVRLDPSKNSFMKRVLDCSANHVLREIKHRARIPVPKSCVLVGIADTSKELRTRNGLLEIYACTNSREEGRKYISGKVLISRSPTVAPGDVQLVWAIGEPTGYPKLALYNWENCVVFPCTGNRPLASMLGGGDLDGDEYLLLLDPELHPTKCDVALNYGKAVLKTVSHEVDITDVKRFVVDYIINDILGMIATQQLVTADKFPEGLRHKDCLTLAVLHSVAVDFPKTGKCVTQDQLPKQSTGRLKPDWYAGELVHPNAQQGFYKSTRILGHLFRAIELPVLDTAGHDARRQRGQNADPEHGPPGLRTDKIMELLRADRQKAPWTTILRTRLLDFIDLPQLFDRPLVREIIALFSEYATNLCYISETWSLSRNRPLSEEEVVAGTIVQRTTQARVRKEFTASMRTHSSTLVEKVRTVIEKEKTKPSEEKALRAWAAWRVSEVLGTRFGAQSFGWIACGVLLDVMKWIEQEERRSARYRPGGLQATREKWGK